MPTATIRFHKCIQDSQDYGSDDQHMVSRVFFSIEAEGKVYPNLTVDIKQTVGADFETGPLEVGMPRGYEGSLDYAPFRVAVEVYYRGLVGAKGAGFHIEGASDVRMRNNVFSFEKKVAVTYSDKSPAW